ncbi:hypothetical protein [Novosphingobium huizhouense]|uniref:hypothetical protein n=1 Tax=Novosphingobium huizhouense TaxID=2866625 RepID=UPI001CD8C1AA|nr:hypothetical protein [Novosphingobium huizhouense]
MKLEKLDSGMSTEVAQMRIARDLHHAEAALDEALVRQAQLLQTMVGARRETGVAPFLGQDALLRLIRSQQTLVDAGGELARVHGRLSTIGAETNGGNDACPPAAREADDDLSAKVA